VLINASWAAFGIFATAFVGLLVTLLTGGWLPTLLRRLGTPIAQGLTEKLVGMLEAFVSGLQALPNVKSVAAFIVYTLVYWVANGTGLYLVALGFGWDLPFISGFVLVCVLVVGIMIPAGPGFLGTFQVALMAGLAIFGVSESEAAAYTMVIYPCTMVVQVGFGLPFVLRSGAHVAELEQVREELG
jgi:uncharacterized protein (TIRG00374 family)